MIYASVASGIEAATVAWHKLGWQPVWFSQHDPEHNYATGPDFPSRVLQYHYPDVPNLGNMLKLKENQVYNESTIDLLVGGTPCQSFSIAGLRGGLDEGRGNLSLEYARILITKRPRWFKWENVPGVLSTGKDEDGKNVRGKDFACLLSAWTGLDITPQRFGNSGIIRGKFYSIAWRTLDAQYFGVPQRRKRVFVIGYLGNDWRPPAAVLFERESLRQDFTPGEEKREELAEIARRNTNRTENAVNYIDPIAYDFAQITNKHNRSNPKPNSPCHTLNQNCDATMVTAICETIDNKGTATKKRIIRRLTPLECERLQGFPDNYTLIEYQDNKGRTKKSVNSLRYKAISNSMAIPVMYWIGKRIDTVDKIIKASK